MKLFRKLLAFRVAAVVSGWYWGCEVVSPRYALPIETTMDSVIPALKSVDAAIANRDIADYIVVVLAAYVIHLPCLLSLALLAGVAMYFLPRRWFVYSSFLPPLIGMLFQNFGIGYPSREVTTLLYYTSALGFAFIVAGCMKRCLPSSRNTLPEQENNERSHNA